LTIMVEPAAQTASAVADPSMRGTVGQPDVIAGAGAAVRFNAAL